MSLTDKVAFITGAASGVGLYLAQTYARLGAKVVLADRNIAAASLAAQALTDAGLQALAVMMDVTDEQAVQAGVEAAVAMFGGLDILVSNAGIQHIESIDQCSLAHWRHMLAIHLDGAFLTTRAALRVMYEQKRGGSIIYMGSAHSKLASKLKAPYVTCKHGLLGLCRVVALEGAAHGVRANVICPGYIKTPLVEQQIPEQAARLDLSEADVIQKIFLHQTANGEFTTLEDVAQVAVFLADFESCALTGQSLLVSHGWGME